MFLMTLKQLMWVFFFLSIINIPLYTFYWQVNTQANPKSSFFQKFAMANSAQDDTCEELTFGRQTYLKFECPRKMSTISDLKFIGIAKNDTASCRGAIVTHIPSRIFTEGCYYDFDVQTPNAELTTRSLDG